MQTEPPLQPVPERPPVERPEPERESWRSILDDLLSDVPLKPEVEPIGFAHNGFHVDDEQRFQPLPPTRGPPSRHQRYRGSSESPHPEYRFAIPFRPPADSRVDPDDAASYGRHSMPGRD